MHVYTETDDEDEYFRKRPDRERSAGGRSAGGNRGNGLYQGRLNGKPSRKDGNLTRYPSDAYDGTQSERMFEENIKLGGIAEADSSCPIADRSFFLPEWHREVPSPT